MVITTLCDCMAGLSAACSHVGAILCSCEAGARIEGSRTCTGEKNKWLMPSYVKEIPYLPVSEMDFKSAKRKHKLLLDKNTKPTTTRMLPVDRVAEYKTSADEQTTFFENLSRCGTKPGILSLVSPFNGLYVPKQVELPMPITEQFNGEHDVNTDLSELLIKCRKINISANECKTIESSTTQQSKSSVWFKQRSGRITASKLKDACHTNVDKPSVSLIKSVCYPENYKFSNDATLSNESKARSAYEQSTAKFHQEFTVSDSGLHVNPEWPYLGASPDGIVNCSCCGRGACEVKCPYSILHLNPNEVADEQENFFLKKIERKVVLDRHHKYFYQVQAQIFVCNVDYCDFIVWTTKGLYVERILPDVEFWRNAVVKVKDFFYKGILPEIVGKWFSKPSIQHHCEQLSSDDDDAEWCIFQKSVTDSTTLVHCHNPSCRIRWYHLACLRMNKAPEGTWFCPQCYRESQQL